MTSHFAFGNGRRRATARPGDQPVGRVRGEDQRAGAREVYHDPTAGIAGAPPARSALTLRLALAGFGVMVCVLWVFVVVVHAPVAAAVVALLGTVALVEIVVVARRKRHGEPG